MIWFKSKLKIIAIIIIIIIGTILAFLFLKGTFDKSASESNTKQTSLPTQVSQNDKPQIVSTKPDPLENTVVSAAEIIEITFNRPLENVGEFKLRIEPKIEYKVELSSDRKTAKIIPTKPYELGTTYTMFIGPETKFDGVGNWGEEKVFHFQTIKYTGV